MNNCANITSLFPLGMCPSLEYLFLIGDKYSIFNKISILPLVTCERLKQLNILYNDKLKDIDEFIERAPINLKMITTLKGTLRRIG